MPNPENLMPPPKPGEVRNPHGHNQYTYRDNAKRDLEKWCKDHGADFVEALAQKALEGESWAAQLLWKEILPPEAKHEIRLAGTDALGLGDALASVAKSRRSNGHDLDADPGSNGGGA